MTMDGPTTTAGEESGASAGKSESECEPWDTQFEELEQESGALDQQSDAWDDDDPLPAKRGRLMTPLTWVLASLALGTGGFILGTRIERSHAASTAAAAVAAQFQQVQGGAPAGGFGGSRTGSLPGAIPGTATGSAASTGAAPAAQGTIKLVDGTTIYIDDGNGGVVVVNVGTDTNVTDSATTSIDHLVAGTAVVVQGTTNADGTVTATAISASPG